MQRRTFLGGLLASLGGLVSVRAAETTATNVTESFPSHYFDWQGDPEPHTDDPRWTGKLRRGRHNRVFVDGVELDRSIVRMQTGERGWVEFLKRDEGGGYVTEAYDLENGRAVTPEPGCQWIEFNPDGTRAWKYGERLAVERVYGRVEYRPDATA